MFETCKDFEEHVGSENLTNLMLSCVRSNIAQTLRVMQLKYGMTQQCAEEVYMKVRRKIIGADVVPMQMIKLFGTLERNENRRYL